MVGAAVGVSVEVCVSVEVSVSVEVGVSVRVDVLAKISLAGVNEDEGVDVCVCETASISGRSKSASIVVADSIIKSFRDNLFFSGIYTSDSHN